MSIERITHAQAAVLLGCTTSGVSKLVMKGQLTSTGARGPGNGTLDLEQVVKLREERLRAERARRLRYDRVDPQRKRPPADLGDHQWLSVEQVAQRAGEPRARSVREQPAGPSPMSAPASESGFARITSRCG